MEILVLILIAVAVVLSILLTVVAYTIWKYLQRKKQNKDFTDFNDKYTIRPGRINRGSRPSVDDFQVPVSTRTVNAQMGFLLDCDYSNRPPVEGKSLSLPRQPGARRKSSGFLEPDQNQLGERKPRSESLPLRDKEELLVSLLPDGVYREPQAFTHFEKKQRQISIGAMEHLSKQGRRVSAVDLRGASITEDMFNSSVLGSDFTSRLSLLQEDDTESVYSSHSQNNEMSKSTNDIYNSTTLGQKKRRIGERRAVKSDSGSGYVQPIRRTYKKSGKITFTTQYLPSDRAFEVHILRASDLAPKRDVSEINPFVRLYLLPGKKQKQNTKVLKHRKEPFFNERFLFTGLMTEDLKRYKLKMKVYNSKLTKDEILGEVDIALSSVDLNSKETYNIDLFLQRSEISSVWSTNRETIISDVLLEKGTLHDADVKNQSSLASVGVSICHQATFHKLEVIVQEAKHLPKVGLPQGLPNPYATVSLFKESELEQKDTATKRSTRDPVFKESIELDLHTDHATPLSTFCLVITLNNHSLVGKNEVLGHVIFSLNSPQKQAAEHWKAVQNDPHKHHMQWHSLIDPDEL